MTPKNKLIINCQATHVTAAKFAVQGGKLVLEDFKMQELPYDYSVQDNWLEALRSTLKIMNVSGKATIIAPSMLLLTKTIKIPHVEQSRQKEVIAFEVEKSIPYSIDEVSWDYQVVSDDGVESEIFLTSMKSTSADDLCNVLKNVGIVPESIQASSVLDYNAWKYSGLESDVVILNVGARFTNMLIVRDEGLFVRSIPVGGNALTQSIGDSLGQSFETAEDLKRTFFRDNDDGAMSSAAANITESLNASAKSIMQRLSLEVKRSIVNYRRSGRVTVPTKIFLTGRASLLPGLAEYLAEDQKMNVEFIDVLSDISVSSKVNQTLLSACSVQISELVGEAASMVLPDAMGVNLLPKHVIEEAKFAAKRPLMLISAAILAAAALPPFMFISDSANSIKQYTQKFAQEIPVIEQRIEQLETNKELAEKITAQINGLEGLAKSKSNWINLFIDIEQKLMAQKDVWLDNLDVVRTIDGEKTEYKLNLTGRLLLREVSEDADSFNSKNATEKIDKLLESFKSSDFIETYSDVKTDPSNPRILKFDFTLVVNKEKPI